jgi:hypothetical protein
MTKLECEVVKPHMQVYCSPKLAEHAARHAGRNAVQSRGTVQATPRARVTGGGPDFVVTLHDGDQPYLAPGQAWMCAQLLSLPNRSLEDASLSRYQVSKFKRSELCRPRYSIDQATPSTTQVPGPLRQPKNGHLAISRSGKSLPLRPLLS